MIPVTQTFLPSIDAYKAILQNAWDKKWLTNRGDLVVELEHKLKSYLNTDNILITNNGTLPLQMAIKAMNITGEIITTPFSFVATTAAIVWENCIPVFVDIHPEYLTIDETKIEEAITPKTSAILATHVFGNPCHIEAIEKIAQKHNLKVIYDAAHCFGVTYNGESVFNFGDVSTCSFHATKIFHTGEGGAVFCKDEILREKLFACHNFGFNGPYNFSELGINAKISELHAAMGLAVLPHMSHILTERKMVCDFYDENLKLQGIKKLRLRENTEWNYSYYPVIFENEGQLKKVLEILNANNIFPRRYFYPSLNTIEYVNSKSMPVSESIAAKILCLPLYVGLQQSELSQICELINSNIPAKLAVA